MPEEVFSRFASNLLFMKAALRRPDNGKTTQRSNLFEYGEIFFDDGLPAPGRTAGDLKLRANLLGYE
jgi:hypothetical protein